MNTIAGLTEKILRGYRIKRGDDLSLFLTAPLDELKEGAGVLQRHFCGNHVDFCTIINGRSGRCSEDCKYCAQSACHHTGCDEYDFLPKKNHGQCQGQSGCRCQPLRHRYLRPGPFSGKDFEKALDTYRTMKGELHIGLCASHGLLTRAQLHALRQTGVTSYHHNIETSRRFFPQICTTHTYDDRIRTIKDAQAEGLCVCSGGIIGMGETWEDRLDMAISLAELGIESIPINALMPIPGTPFEGREELSGDDILRTIAFFRFINPEANIRLAAGRKLLPENGATALLCGASASITGNMLTTSGSTIVEDMAMIKRLGLTNDAAAEGGNCGTTCAS